MPVNNENFDQLKIDKLKHFLEDMAGKGQARPYEIFVDALKVVPKTEDPKDFDSYEYYMNEDTEKIRILIYNSNLSPRNDQYSFFVQKNRQDKSTNGLGEIDAIIQEKLTARDREYELNSLKEELAQVKEKLEESEDYAESLEKELNEKKNNKFKIGKNDVTEFIGMTLGELIKSNTKFIARIPGAGALAGLIEQANVEEAKARNEPTNEGEVSFQKKGETPEGLTENQQRNITFFSMLEEQFNEMQLNDMMLIMQKFAEDPIQMKTVKQLLNIQN